MPLTVTSKLPEFDELVVTFRVDKAVPPGGTVTTDGVIVAPGPGGETLVDRDTAPVNRLKLLTLILDVADAPGGIVNEFGVALREKSEDIPESLQAVRGCSSHPEKL